MIPFATWSQAQIEREVPVWKFPTRHLLNEAEQAVQSDLADLVDGIVENIHQSTVVQLRTTLKLAGRNWAEQQAIKQESFVFAELRKAEERILSVVADLLCPVLTDLQLREMMEEFSVTLKKLLPEFNSQDLVIKSPPMNSAMLKEALDAQAINAEIVDSDDGDISVASNSVVLAASLSDWTQRLRRVALA
jgi:hypothetical protein